MKRIALSQGKFALVDDEDYQDLSQEKWYALRDSNTFYAARGIRIDKKKSIEQMHRRILGLKRGDGKHTDHINGDGLDNRRNNLRIATNIQNGQNRTIRQSNNTSGFKGVCWYKKDKKWVAQIQINSQHKHLGYYKSKIDAATAYNRAAIKYFGKFAKLNRISPYLRRKELVL